MSVTVDFLQRFSQARNARDPEWQLAFRTEPNRDEAGKEQSTNGRSK